MADDATKPTPYIRPATPADSPAVSRICLLTADAGASAASLHAAGELPLDQLVTKTYPLDRINDGYEDMRNGTNIRGVLLPRSGG